MPDPTSDPIRQFSQASVDELERQYREPRAVSVPRGAFRGVHLGWLDTPAAHHPVLRPLEELFFARLPWWVDFDRRRWFWFHRSISVAHFTPSAGPSRWRDTDALRLLYDDRHLPERANQFLYDEVKPLNDEVCLGLGGISDRRGVGEQFFFLLVRDRARSA